MSDEYGAQFLVTDSLFNPSGALRSIGKKETWINQHRSICPHNQSRHRTQSHITRNIMVRRQSPSEPQNSQHRLQKSSKKHPKLSSTHTGKQTHDGRSTPHISTCICTPVSYRAPGPQVVSPSFPEICHLTICDSLLTRGH